MIVSVQIYPYFLVALRLIVEYTARNIENYPQSSGVNDLLRSHAGIMGLKVPVAWWMLVVCAPENAELPSGCIPIMPPTMTMSNVWTVHPLTDTLELNIFCPGPQRLHVGQYQPMDTIVKDFINWDVTLRDEDILFAYRKADIHALHGFRKGVSPTASHGYPSLPLVPFPATLRRSRSPRTIRFLALADSEKSSLSSHQSSLRGPSVALDVDTDVSSPRGSPPDSLFRRSNPTCSTNYNPPFPGSVPSIITAPPAPSWLVPNAPLPPLPSSEAPKPVAAESAPAPAPAPAPPNPSLSRPSPQSLTISTGNLSPTCIVRKKRGLSLSNYVSLAMVKSPSSMSINNTNSMQNMSSLTGSGGDGPRPPTPTVSDLPSPTPALRYPSSAAKTVRTVKEGGQRQLGSAWSANSARVVGEFGLVDAGLERNPETESVSFDD
ncbi:hypothetical protein FS837_009239 [Tulasnella sp. UAMH 9824]|nr:hypothetical protein FS837_009239 [Tulasnella sp. UAMH 9824]